jgi:uncharacterized protein HemX
MVMSEFESIAQIDPSAWEAIIWAILSILGLGGTGYGLVKRPAPKMTSEEWEQQRIARSREIETQTKALQESLGPQLLRLEQQLSRIQATLSSPPTETDELSRLNRNLERLAKTHGAGRGLSRESEPDSSSD